MAMLIPSIEETLFDEQFLEWVEQVGGWDNLTWDRIKSYVMQRFNYDEKMANDIIERLMCNGSKDPARTNLFEMMNTSIWFPETEGMAELPGFPY